jgi:zinc transport system substrate-binding protein
MGKITGKRLLSLAITVMLSIMLMATSAISCRSEEADTEKTVVVVSILPQVDFVERIGGDKVQVSEMIPPGFSPATYDPSPEQLQKLQEADLYFRIGHVPFEKAQMEKLESLNPDMKVVDTSEGIDLLNGTDPHIWLSPKLVKIQAKHIYDALVEYVPQNKDYFTQNYNQFIADLDELDQKLEDAFTPIKGQTILVFHPAFGYLADAYGFHQASIEIQGKDPTPAQLQEIIDKAKSDGVKVIFVQEQFSTESAEAVAQAIGGAVVQINPLAKDYFSNLESMAETIVSAIK